MRPKCIRFARQLIEKYRDAYVFLVFPSETLIGGWLAVNCERFVTLTVMNDNRQCVFAHILISNKSSISAKSSN